MLKHADFDNLKMLATLIRARSWYSMHVKPSVLQALTAFNWQCVVMLALDIRKLPLLNMLLATYLVHMLRYLLLERMEKQICKTLVGFFCCLYCNYCCFVYFKHCLEKLSLWQHQGGKDFILLTLSF